MGFKCPICFKDFKANKKEWEKHCRENHNKLAFDMVNILSKIVNKPEPEEINKEKIKCRNI